MCTPSFVNIPRNSTIQFCIIVVSSSLFYSETNFAMATRSGQIPYLVQIVMYVGFKFILLLGLINRWCFDPKIAGHKFRRSFKNLFGIFEEMYFYYIYRRVSDCSHTPISSRASTRIVINERASSDHGWTWRLTGRQQKCINLSSFNYLGLVDDSYSQAEEITQALDDYGITSPLGNVPLHYQLEKLTAKFLGTEDAITFSAGFATNALNLPAILTKECLVLSDEKNHASLILGMKLSEARILKFRHNDYVDLENKIIECLHTNIRSGGCMFKKLLIITEGIYSMDGTIVDLPKIVELKKKYKAYLFIDDAHGVGCLGKLGRGICDYHNVNPQEIDLLMGTYSKAFASNGGYICGKKETINYLRNHSHASYGASMSPAAVQKAICSIKTLIKNEVENEENRLVRKLHENARYMREKLLEAKLNICGDENSHIIPWNLGTVSAVALGIRELRNRGIAAAGVVYPATPLLGARIRFNACSAHTREELDKVVNDLKDMSSRFGLNYNGS